MADTVNTSSGGEQPRVEVRQPIVRSFRKGRRRSGTSSRGTRRLTEIERRVTKATRRVSRALNHGVNTYIDHRAESREKRRDGVIVDFVENASYGVSQAISEA